MLQKTEYTAPMLSTTASAFQRSVNSPPLRSRYVTPGRLMRYPAKPTSATRGASVQVTPTPGRTAKLLSASIAAPAGAKLFSNSALLNDGPATIENVVSTVSLLPTV